jgi:hypothetical protein
VLWGRVLEGGLWWLFVDGGVGRGDGVGRRSIDSDGRGPENFKIGHEGDETPRLHLHFTMEETGRI